MAKENRRYPPRRFKDGRAYTKVIKMVKSPKTGAYIFDEQMVPNEAVKDFFKN